MYHAKHRLLLCVVVLFYSAEVYCSVGEDEDVTLERKVQPVMRFVFGGTVATASMGEEAKRWWAPAFGVSAEISLAGGGLIPVFQMGYFTENSQWFHLVPVDIAGRYLWDRGKFKGYITGGMSLLVEDEKKNTDTGQHAGDWEVSPVVFTDIGVRYMFRRHFGIEIRVEYRTYIVVNMIGLKIGLAI